MSKYVFDSVRWLRNWSARKRFLLADGRDPFALVADEVARLKAEIAALMEAVAWERECCQDIRPLVAWADLYARHGEDYVDAIAEELREIQDAARAEVDRLIASQGSADCQGEG